MSHRAVGVSVDERQTTRFDQIDDTTIPEVKGEENVFGVPPCHDKTKNTDYITPSTPAKDNTHDDAPDLHLLFLYQSLLVPSEAFTVALENLEDKMTEQMNTINESLKALKDNSSEERLRALESSFGETGERLKALENDALEKMQEMWRKFENMAKRAHDNTEFLATGDEAAHDRIKQRYLLERLP